MKPLLRVFTVAILIIAPLSAAHAQWTQEWTSNSLSSGVLSGWLSFERTGDSWQYRYFTLDSLAFRVMTSPMSATPQYTYNFTAAERLAGEYLYSLGVDLTGDGVTEFYVFAAYGTSPYRQTVKVFDVTNGQTIIERNVMGYSYSAASVWDVDGDGIFECVFTRSDYPAAASYSYEIYNTGVSGLADRPVVPEQLNLRQNYPNPFNPSTRIDYQLRTTGHVELEILNVLGQNVRTLTNGVQSAGSYSVLWDGADGAGNRQASGAYYYQIRLNGQPLQTRQMILLK